MVSDRTVIQPYPPCYYAIDYGSHLEPTLTQLRVILNRAPPGATPAGFAAFWSLSMQEATAGRAKSARRAEAPRAPEWYRVSFALSLIPPAPDKWVSVDISAKTKRITISAPKPLLVAVALAVVSSHPAAAAALQWVLQLLRHV